MGIGLVHVVDQLSSRCRGVPSANCSVLDG